MEKEFLYKGTWDDVYTSEPIRCPFTIAAMRKGIQHGFNKFPYVKVSLDGDNNYTVVDGNHTALSHCLEDGNCLFDICLHGDDILKRSKIRDCVFDKESVNITKLFNSLKYLPENLFKDFCVENDFDYEFLLSSGRRLGILT